MEQQDVNRTLHVTVAAGRIDLTEWLMDEWGAEHDDRPYGQGLAEHTIFEHFYDFEGLFKRRTVQDESSYHQRGQRHWERVLTRWERHQPPTNHLHSVLSTLPPTTRINSAALSALITADLADKSGTRHMGRELLKRGQLLTESSAPGHPAMLTFLADRLGGDGLPRLSVIVAGGAIWALEWLLNSGQWQNHLRNGSRRCACRAHGRAGRAGLAHTKSDRRVGAGFPVRVARCHRNA